MSRIPWIIGQKIQPLRSDFSYSFQRPVRDGTYACRDQPIWLESLTDLKRFLTEVV
jgi:hypothetical protein